MARVAGLFSCAVVLAACSTEPSFGFEGGASAGTSESTASLPATSGSTSSGDGGQGPAGPTSSVTTGGGAGGEGQQSSAGGAGEGGGGGEPSSCVTDDDCPETDVPCVEPACDDGGSCFLSPLPAGTDGGSCGICQGGMWLGSCGMRLWTRSFPSSDAPWSAIPISDQWNAVNAPPPDGIDEAEHTRELGRLFVFHENGMVYERVVGEWAAPVSIAARFPGWVEGTRVGAAAIWKPEAAVATETIFLTTMDPPLTAFAFDIDSQAGITSAGEPEVIGDEADPDAPPQESEPFDWAFVEQRAYITESNDWVVFWEGLGGRVYEYWGGNGDFVSSEDDATSVLRLDGMSAPAPGSVRAAWLQDGTVYVVAP